MPVGATNVPSTLFVKTLSLVLCALLSLDLTAGRILTLALTMGVLATVATLLTLTSVRTALKTFAPVGQHVPIHWAHLHALHRPDMSVFSMEAQATSASAIHVQEQSAFSLTSMNAR